MNIVDGWLAQKTDDSFKLGANHAIRECYKKAFEYVSVIKSTDMFSKLIHQYDYHTAMMDTTPIGLYTCFPINEDSMVNLLSFELYQHPIGMLFKVINPHMIDISSILKDCGFINYDYFEPSETAPIPNNIKDHEWEIRRKIWMDVSEANSDPIIGGLILNGRYRSLQSLLKKAKITQIKSVTRRIGELVHRSGQPTVDRMIELNNKPLKSVLKPLDDPFKLLSVSKYTYLMDM